MALLNKNSSLYQSAYPDNLAKTWSERVQAYYYLCRFDKPIGTELVLWPTMIALWMAAQGMPDWRILLPMLLGVVFMRAAGCAINDFADRKVDGHVTRTKTRPLATGVIRPIEALWVFFGLIIASASLLLFLPLSTFFWSFGALVLAFIYPFMKRYTHLPQVFLGAAFSWAIPMAYSAVGKTPDLTCWLLYFANLAWTVAYDTQYAMTDREDDLKIGVKSTAILFGRYDVATIFALQIVSVGLWCVAFYRENMLFGAAGLALLAVLADFIYQTYRIRHREPQQTFWAFRHNRWIGLMLWAAMAVYFASFKLV
ncbi:MULTISPECIES: 4-hydroxybenzoate octaprenyltransferase [unclassified Acinetobacter]|uniref:4-hydroxybenzoate octaprenyltransferase n=1 Tax=unclassified Acinetobacter TaxID=196816 RepID=UPI0035B8BF98